MWLQAVTPTLIDLLCQYTSPQAVALSQSSYAPPEYANLGLFRGAPIELQSLILKAIMHTIHEPKDFVYLGKHALPICLPPLLQFAQNCMDRYVRADKTVMALIDVTPYCKMLGRSSSLHTACHHYLPGNSSTAQVSLHWHNRVLVNIVLSAADQVCVRAVRS